MSGPRTTLCETRRPACGYASLWLLAAATVIVVVSFISPVGFFGESGIAIIITGLYGGGILSIASVLLAVIGLARRERPRWPALEDFTEYR